MKPGATTSPLASIDLYRAPDLFCQSDDATVFDSYVRTEPRIAGSINDTSVCDD